MCFAYALLSMARRSVQASFFLERKGDQREDLSDERKFFPRSCHILAWSASSRVMKGTLIFEFRMPGPIPPAMMKMQRGRPPSACRRYN